MSETAIFASLIQRVPLSIKAHVLPATTASVMATKPMLMERVISVSRVSSGGSLSDGISPSSPPEVCFFLRRCSCRR